MPLFTQILAASLAFAATPLDQDGHRRILFNEEWRRSYLIVSTIKSMNTVRFEACDVKEANICEKKGAIEFSALPRLQEPMLAMLRDFRAEIERDSGKLSHWLSRGLTRSNDAKAVDAIIADIETNGIENWVLLTKENIGKDSPAFTTPLFAHELMDRIYSLISHYPANPERCRNQLRQLE